MKEKITLKDLWVLVSGMFIVAIAVYFFLMPGKLAIGSMSGFLMVVANYIPLPMSILTFAMNGILLTIAFLLIGSEFGAKTVISAVLLPVYLAIFEVVVPNDSLDEVEDGYGNGQTVLITPENSEFFVRTRDINAPHSAIARQERQIAYLEAAFSKVEEQYEKDPGMAADLYEDLSEHLVTNMGTEVFADLMDGLYSGGQISTVSLPGESVVGEQYDEFHVNDDQLYQLVIETFYKKVEK